MHVFFKHPVGVLTNPDIQLGQETELGTAAAAAVAVVAGVNVHDTHPAGQGTQTLSKL